MTNPFKSLSKKEWALWLSSVALIVASFVVCKSVSLVTVASLIGCSGLIFVSKGHVFGQFLMLAFSITYGIISLGQQYYGEAITYMGMTGPVAVVSIVLWLRNPYSSEKTEVKVRKATPRDWILLSIATVVVTQLFYWILEFFNTNNLVVSTFSVTTSFAAATLSAMRSPYYALVYALNDVVLIILWSCILVSDFSYLPMVVCFVVFLANDIYGLINWKIMEKRQRS